jgi:hypothetical protein
MRISAGEVSSSAINVTRLLFTLTDRMVRGPLDIKGGEDGSANCRSREDRGRRGGIANHC